MRISSTTCFIIRCPALAGRSWSYGRLYFLYAFWRRDRLLQLMAFWVVITPLPLAFIPARGGAMLYIVLFGWAMIIARMLSDLIGLIARVAGLAGPRTAMLPTFATAAVAVAFAVFTHWENQRF